MADLEPTGADLGRAGNPGTEPTPEARARSRALHLVREPVVVVLILAGAVDTFTELTWAHGALLIAAGALLAWDLAVSGGAETEASQGWNLKLTPRWAVAGVAYALLAGSFARYTWPSTFAALILGVGALVVAWRGRFPGRQIPQKLFREGAFAWAGFFLAVALFELANLMLQPSLTTDSYAHPTASVLMDPVLATYVGRALAMILWMALGWFLLER